MWPTEIAELVVAVALVATARALERYPPRASRETLTSRSIRHDEADEAADVESVRAILRGYIDMLHFETLIELQEAAALLAAGEHLDVLFESRRQRRQPQKRNFPPR